MLSWYSFSSRLISRRLSISSSIGPMSRFLSEEESCGVFIEEPPGSSGLGGCGELCAQTDEPAPASRNARTNSAAATALFDNAEYLSEAEGFPVDNVLTISESSWLHPVPSKSTSLQSPPAQKLLERHSPERCRISLPLSHYLMGRPADR